MDIMKYTEEEKKAIELLDELIINANTEDADMNNCFGGEHIEAIEVLKNLLKKQQALMDDYKTAFNNEKYIVKEQQKKIEELRNVSRELIDSYNEENEKWQKERNENGRLKRLVRNSIPKKAVREKIKEKQKRINQLHPASDCVIIDDLENQIKAYAELLGE